MRAFVLCAVLLVACAGHLEQLEPERRVLRHGGQHAVELSAESFRAAVDAITVDLPTSPPFVTSRIRIQLAAANPAEVEAARRYLAWCGQEGRPGGDCAGVLDGGQVFTEDARIGFAFHVALQGAMVEAGKSLRSIRPEQVRAALSLAMLVTAGLMVSPEPFSKLLAVGLACNLIAYLGVDLYNHVALGYWEMRKAAKARVQFEDLLAIGDWYAKQLGPSIARITVMLATYGIAKLGMAMPVAPPGLPGAAVAAANAEAAGLPVGQAVEGVAVAADGTVTVTVGGTVAMAVGGPGAAPVDEEPSSEKLDRNMRAAGMKRPPGTAAHHIVAGKAGFADKARAILRKFGIGINDAENGVYLPCNSKTPCEESGAIHSQLHTREYYLAVNRALEEASTREQIIEKLRDIADRLKAGGYP
jgi:HNH/ENDO VII superfamily nuclease